MIFHQLTNRAHTTVTKVVNVVNAAFAVTQINQRLDTGNDIFTTQRALSVFGIQCQTHVHFHTANRGKVITLAIKEQRVKQRRSGFNGGRLARTHNAVDVHQRGVTAHVFINRQRVAHVRANIGVVDIQNRNVGDARVQQLFQCAADHFAFFVQFMSQLITSFDINRTGFFVDDVLGDIFPKDLINWQQQVLDLALVDQFLHGPWRDFLASFSNHFASLRIHQIENRTCAANTVREKFGDPAFVLFQFEIDGVVIGIHDLFLVQTQRIQQRCHRQLTATVNPREHDVFGVEFEIQP